MRSSAAFSIAMILMAIGPVASRGDELIRKRFLQDYPIVSKFWHEKFSQVSAVVSSEPKPGVKSDRAALIRFAREGEGEIVEIRIEVKLTSKSERIDQVFVYRPDQYFELMKMDGDAEFQIKVLGHPEAKSGNIANYDGSYGRLLTVPFGMLRYHLPTVMSRPENECLDTSVDTSRPNMMQVKYAIPSGADKQVVTYDLDTSNHWAVMAQEWQTGKKAKSNVNMEVEYRPNAAGFALPVKARFSRREGEWSTYSYSEWKFDPVDSSVFRLSHYSLPEIEIPGRRNSSVSRILMVAIVTILSISILFLFRKRFVRSVAGN